MEKVVGLPFVGWEQFPVMGHNRKSFSLYFLFHLFSAALLDVRCLPAWVWLSYRGCSLPGTGEICPPAQGFRAGWVGEAARAQPTHAGYPALLQDQHGGLARISKAREDGGAEDERAEGWQGLALVRQHMPVTRARHVSPGSSRHPLVAALL